MLALGNIPNVNAPEENSPDIVLRPVKIVHEDGSIETVYIQDLSGPADNRAVHRMVHLHLSTMYLLVGIIALGMGAYVTYRQLKNGHS